MLRRSRGQSASETTLVVSVIVLTALAASATLIPLFQSGVRDLGGDAKLILETGSVGGVGAGGSRGANASASGAPRDPSAPGATPSETTQAANALDLLSPMGKQAQEVIETRERIINNIGPIGGDSA